MIGDLLQRAQYQALAAAQLRAYDTPPADAEFPYFGIGDEQNVDDGSACGAAWEVFADVHVWSRPTSGSRSEVKTLMQQAEPLLTALTLPGFRVVVQHLQTARSMTDPDGITKHGVMTFRYLIDPA
jgi:hypothetical protein